MFRKSRRPQIGRHRLGLTVFRARLGALLLLPAMVGCSSLGSIEPPQVNLADLEVTEVTIFETTLVASLRVTNPNPEPLTLDGGTFELVLDDKKFGSGTVQESFTVERLGSVEVNAIIHVNNASLALRVKDLLDRQVVTYGLRGAFFTQGTFGTSKLRVDRSGVLDLSEPAPRQPVDDTVER